MEGVQESAGTLSGTWTSFIKLYVENIIFFLSHDEQHQMKIKLPIST